MKCLLVQICTFVILVFRNAKNIRGQVWDCDLGDVAWTWLTYFLVNLASLTFVTESTMFFFPEISWVPLNIDDFHLVNKINVSERSLDTTDDKTTEDLLVKRCKSNTSGWYWHILVFERAKSASLLKLG